MCFRREFDPAVLSRCSCSFFGSDIGASCSVYLLKDKEVSHKGTWFSLPGFVMFGLLLGMYFCDLLHNAAYMCFYFFTASSEQPDPNKVSWEI